MWPSGQSVLCPFPPHLFSKSILWISCFCFLLPMCLCLSVCLSLALSVCLWGTRSLCWCLQSLITLFCESRSLTEPGTHQFNPVSSQQVQGGPFISSASLAWGLITGALCWAKPSSVVAGGSNPGSCAYAASTLLTEPQERPPSFSLLSNSFLWKLESLSV